MSIPSWARKGVKVICVDASSNTDAGLFYVARERWPVEGMIYTIEDIGRDPFEDSPTLFLVEHPREEPDPGFLISRFRPLVEDSSDNEIETVLYRKRKDKLHQRVSTKSRERA